MEGNDVYYKSHWNSTNELFIATRPLKTKSGPL